MPPVSVRLKGFKGIRAGIGLDEVEIDFSNLPTGLIAIVGKTGRGKTTLLDNLHHYRIMPYKLRDTKEWSTGSFSYYDQCYGRDAVKEYVSEFCGKRYRSVIQIDAERRKQEAYFYIMSDNGAWVPYNDSVKDGKTGAYDQAVEEVFGSLSLHFSSVFRSQDARRLSSYPRSEILGIICELLHVDHIKEQGEKAAKVVSALGTLVDDLERQKLPIKTLLDSREDLKASRQNTLDSISVREGTLESLKTALAGVEEQIRELELSNAAQALTRKRVDELRLRYESLQSDIKEQEDALRSGATDNASELVQIDANLTQVAEELERDTASLVAEQHQEKETADNDLAGIASKISEVESLLARSGEINQAVARAADIEKELVSDRGQLDTLRSAQGALEANVTGLLATAADIENGAQQDLKAFQQDSGSLNAEKAREESAANGELVSISSKKRSVEAILGRSDEIKQAVVRETELSSQLSIDKPKLETMRAEASDLRVKIAALKSVDNEIISSQKRLDDLRNLADGLKGLDCHGDGTKVVNKSCKLLASAVEAEKQIPSVQEEITRLNESLAERGKLIQRLTDLTSEGTELAAKVEKADTELATVRQTALLVSDLTNAEVRVSEYAAQAEAIRTNLKQRLDNIVDKLQVLTDRSNTRQSELAAQKVKTETALTEAQEQLGKNSDSISFFVSQIAESEADLAETQTVAALLTDLASAETRIAELKQQALVVQKRADQRIADLGRKIAEISERTQERRNSLVAKKQEVVNKWETAKAGLESKLSSLFETAEQVSEEARKLEATLNGDVASEIGALNVIVTAKQSEIAAEENSLKGLHASLGNITGQLDDLDQKEAGLSTIDAEITRINDEVVNWKLLAKACSNDGIIALELDDAGPAIATVTNDLLHACYGPRFSVRLETQGMKALGGLKEIFDIIVYDAERDEIKSIRDMSGGEVTYIEDAITRAFCLYNLHRSDRRYDTLYSDEKDAALDFELKSEFMAIKRKALDLGTHDREFFITHTPELFDKADARIFLEPGRISIS